MSACPSRTALSTDKYFNPSGVGLIGQLLESLDHGLGAPLGDRGLREVDLRQQLDALIAGLRGRLEGLLVERPRGSGVAEVEEPVALEVEDLSRQGPVLELLRELQRVGELRLSRIGSAEHGLGVSRPAQDLAHPESAVLEVLEGLQRFLLRVDGRAVLPLVLEQGPHAVRLDRRAPLVAGLSSELEGAQVMLEGLVVLPLVRRGLGKVVQGVGDVAGVLGLLPDLESPLEVGLGVVVLRLEKVDVADVVQTERFSVLIADVALDLQRLLVVLQRLVVVSATRVETSEVDEASGRLLSCRRSRARSAALPCSW